MTCAERGDQMKTPDNHALQLFEDQKIRVAWDAEREEWYFSVQDVVAVLSESTDPKQYIKKMRARDPQLSANWGTICTPVQMLAADGKQRKVQAANIEGILRIIQSVPSKKVEPFKAWLAMVGRERIEETIDPEQAIDRALETYLKKGYSEEWVHQRLLAIRIRNELTDEWRRRGEKSTGSRDRQAGCHRAERRELPPACHGYRDRRGAAAGEKGDHK